LKLLRKDYFMPKTLAEITKDAADLPPQDRLKLARIMLDLSEDEREDPADVDRAWNDEIERRIEEMRTGKVKGVPLEAVKKRIESKFRR
jgi:putative addiction module component (TIGR02574 family)